MKLHIGPGEDWQKPSDDWLTLDIDPKRGDVVCNLNKVDCLPFEDKQFECIYGGHVFEHVNIYQSPKIFAECCRILKPGGVIRIVIPNVSSSIEAYVKGNKKYFKAKIARAKRLRGIDDYRIFEALREDFIAPSRQQGLLGDNSPSHQNAWDFEALKAELKRAGFKKVFKMDYLVSSRDDFGFEKEQPRSSKQKTSLYAEAIK